VISADFNNDKKLDLAVANAGDNTVSVMLGNGNGIFQNQTLYLTGTAPTSVISGDLNNHNKPDLFVTNSGSGDLSVLLNVCK
jgi:hypothetical protein